MRGMQLVYGLAEVFAQLRAEASFHVLRDPATRQLPHDPNRVRVRFHVVRAIAADHQMGLERLANLDRELAGVVAVEQFPQFFAG